MNTKYHISSILIFFVFFLLQFSVKAQNNSDTIVIGTITVEKKGNRVIDYYQEGRILQLMNLTKENEMAYQLMRQARDLRVTSVCLYVTGGAFLGFSAGYAIGSTIIGRPIQMKLFLPFLGAGAGLLICGGILESVAQTKILKGVEIFNRPGKQNNHTSFNLDFAPNELTLRLNF